MLPVAVGSDGVVAKGLFVAEVPDRPGHRERESGQHREDDALTTLMRPEAREERQRERNSRERESNDTHGDSMARRVQLTASNGTE